MIRRIRALIVLALLWGVCWSVLGALMGVYQFYQLKTIFVFGSPVGFWELVFINARSWGAGGAVSGALFAIVLSVAERNQSLAHLRLARVVLWGVVGAWLIPGTMIGVELARYGLDLGPVAIFLGLLGAAGGLSAAATLMIARRAKDVGGIADTSLSR
jgi:hypothetical protein